jgi:hypothetical protein
MNRPNQDSYRLVASKMSTQARGYVKRRQVRSLPLPPPGNRLTPDLFLGKREEMGLDRDS